MMMWLARNRDRRGYSLVEMIAVLVVLSLLVSLGVVGYNSVRGRIQEGQTRDILRQVAAAQEAQYRSRGAFVSSESAAIDSVAQTANGYVGPETDPSPDHPNQVSAAKGAAYGSVPVLGLAAWSDTKVCFMQATFAPGSGRAALEGKATAEQLADRDLSCSGKDALTFLNTKDQPANGATPDAPTGLTVAAGPGLLNLSWNPNGTGPTATGYRVYRAASPSEEFDFVADVVGATSFTDSGLDKDTDYTYYLIAYNGAGLSARSATATGRPTDPSIAAPGRPLGLAAKSVTATAVTLEWKPVDGAAGYTVYRNGTTVAVLDEGDANADGHTTATEFTDTGVAAGVKYNYRVDAFSSNNLSSAPYSGINVTTPPAAVPGATLTPLAGVGDAHCDDPACIKVTWTAPPATDATHPSVPDASYLAPLRSYRIYRCDGPTCPADSDKGPTAGMTMAGSVSAGTTSFTDTALRGSAQYAYRVYAVNDHGLSASAGEGAVRTVPAPVTGVSVTPHGPGEVRVSWTEADGAGATISGYRIYAKKANGDLEFAGAVEGADTTHWDAGGLPGFAEVTYVVAAVSTTEGVGIPSGPQSAVTDPAPLTGITTKSTDTSITLTWPRARGITYTVLRDGVVVTTTTTGDFVDDNLTPGTQYTYVVRAANASGGSADSDDVTAWTRPAAPQNVAAQGEGTDLKVTWAAVPGATEYLVYQCTGASCTPTVVAGTTPSPSITFHALNRGTVYTVAVAASNDGGRGATSATAKAATAPNAVTLSADADPRQIELRWTEAPTATSYLVLRNGATIATVTSGRTFTDSDVTGGHVYTYSVIAANDAGQSLPSNTVSTSTAPDAPTGLVADPTATTVTLSWVATGASTYQVFRCTGACVPTDANLVGTVTDGDTKEFTDTGLTALTEYTYTVKAGNGTGWSAMSAPVTVRTPLASPEAFRVTGLDATSISLAWDASAGATGYRIYDRGVLVATVPGGSTQAHTLTGLTPGQRYELTLTAYSPGGVSEPTPALTVTTALPAPTSLRVVSTTTGSVALAWNTSLGAVAYQVLRCTPDEDCTPATVAGTIADGDTGDYIDTGLEANTRYRYAVVAKTAYVTSDPSNVVTGWTVPGKPTGLTVTAVTDHSATLQWPATDNATKYTVYRGAVAVGTVDADTTTFTDDGLAAGTSPSWTYTVTNSGGESAKSDPVTALLKPPAPAGVTATGLDAAVTVTWSAALSATEYVIQRCTGEDCDGDWVTVQTLTAPATAFTDTGLADNTTYGYRVRARNASGDSAGSPVVHALTHPATAGAPRFTAVEHTSVTVEWDAVPGATTYRLYQDGIAEPVYEGAAPTADLAGLVGGNSYTFRVAAGNAGGYAPVGPAGTVALKPAEPTGLTDAGHTDTTVTLTWSPANGATGYAVYVDGTKRTTVAGSTAATITGLDPATAYSFAVAGTNASGEGPTSAPLEVTTNPASPVNVTGTATARGEVTLAWDAVTGATDYSVLRGGSPIAQCTTTTERTCVITGLDDATQYSFTVVAHGAGGSSQESNPVTVTTLAAPPTDLAVVMSGLTATLTWTAPAGTVTGYKVYRCTGEPGCTLEFVTDVATTTFTDSELDAATTYTWAVSAMTTGGESAKSDPESGTTTLNAPTGLDFWVQDYMGPGQPIFVELWWDEIPGATGYAVYRCAGECTPGTSDLVGTVPAGTDWYDDFDVEHNATYTYAVAAINAAGVSPLSAVLAATTNAEPATGVRVVSRTATSLTIGWDAPTTGVTEVKLRAGRYDNFTPVPQENIVVNLASLRATVTGLTGDTQYRVWVDTLNGPKGHWSTSDLLLAATAVGRPANLTVDGTTASTATLSWDAGDGADAYYVYRDGVMVGQMGLGERPDATDDTTARRTFVDGANLLTPAASTFENTTDAVVSARGLTATSSSDQAWTGSTSLKVNWTDLGDSNRDLVVGDGGPGGMRNGMTPGRTYTFSAYAHTPAGGGPAIGIAYRRAGDGAATTVWSADSYWTGKWSRHDVTASLPADTVEAYLLLRVGVPDSTMSVYFDGLQLEGGSAATMWSMGMGVDNLAASYVDPSGGDVSGYTGVSATVTASSVAAQEGSSSIAVTPTNTGSASYAAVGGDASAGTMRLGMQAGRTYTAGAWVYVPSNTTLSPQHANGLKLVAGWYDGATWTETASSRPFGVNRWERLSVTFTVPMGATGSYLRLWNGNSAAYQVVYFDGVTLTPGAVDQDHAPSQGLVPGRAYTYQLDSYGAVSDTYASSNIVTAQTLLAGPQLTATGGQFQASLQWTAVGGATGYTIYRCDTASCTPTAEVAAVGGGATTYTDTGLSGGTAYTYHVVATTPAATSGPSNTATATTAPNAPTNLRQMDPGHAGPNYVSVGWTLPTPSGTWTEVRLYKNGTLFYTGAAASQQVSIPEGMLGANNSAEFYVVASSPSGDSPRSNTITVGRAPAVTAKSGTGRIDLSWPALTGATGYTLWQCDGTGPCDTTGPGTDVGTATSYAVTGLGAGDTVAFAVAARYPTAVSWQRHVTAKSLLTGPTGLVVTGTTATSQSLAWDARDGATSYKVYRDGLPVGTTTGSTFTDTAPNRLSECVATSENCSPDDLTPLNGTTIARNWAWGNDIDSGYLKKATKVTAGAAAAGATRDLAQATFPVSAGEPISAEMYVRNEDPSHKVSVFAHLDFYSGTTKLGSAGSPGYQLVPNAAERELSSGYRRLVVPQQEAPAGATSAKLVLQAYFDESVSALPLFTDGWYAGSSPRPDTSYTYTVSAVVDGEETDASAPTAPSWTNPPRPPRPGLRGASSYQVTLGWDDWSADPYEFEYRVCNGAGAYCDPSSSVALSTGWYPRATVTNETGNAYHSFQVRAVSPASGKYSDWTGTQNVRSNPPPPASITVDQHGLTGGATEAVTFTWPAVPEADTYDLTVTSPSSPGWFVWPCGGTYSTVPNAALTCSWTPLALEAGRLFQVEVRGSNAAQVRPGDNKNQRFWTAPPAPTGASGSVTNTTATMSWNAVAQATGYEVVTSDGNWGWDVVCTTSALTCSFTIPAGESHIYYVRAVITPGSGESGGGVGFNSAGVTLTSIPAAPAAPTVTYTAEGNVLKLTAPAAPADMGVTGWSYLRYKNGALDCAPMCPNPSSSSGTYSGNGGTVTLPANTIYSPDGAGKYTWRIRYTNAAGNSAYSADSNEFDLPWTYLACAGWPSAPYAGAKFVWSLNDRASSSTTAADTCSSSTGYTGTYATAASATNSTTPAGPNHNASAVQFAGESGVTANSATLGQLPTGNASMTWAFSFKQPASGGKANTAYAYFFSQGDTGSNANGFGLRPSVSSTTQAQVVWYNSAGSASTINMASGVNLLDGAWHDIALVKAGTALTLWVDGVQRSTGTLPASTTMVRTCMKLSGWCALTNAGRPGHYDDFAVFNYALLPSQIQALFAAGR